MLPVTSALIAANVAIFLLQNLLPELVIPFALWPWGASQVDPQVGFAPWQLVSIQKASINSFSCLMDYLAFSHCQLYKYNCPTALNVT